MLCIAKNCRTLSPAAVQLRKLVAGGEIPNTAHACIAVIYLKMRSAELYFRMEGKVIWNMAAFPFAECGSADKM